jgi:MoaA/NifB/PqqE/SkfB family radical SAM enzyme
MFVQTNQRCNLRCTHCEYWRYSDERSKYLSNERRAELVREFAEIGGRTIVTCGGEPMLDTEDYFSLCRSARENGLGLFSVINGTRVHSVDVAERMLLEGPSEITVSFDHHLESEHDRLRGRKSSFRLAVRAILLLLAARERLQVKTPIYIMTIVSEDTWRTLDEFYEFALGLGVDKLKLNIMQPTFQGKGPDEYFSSAKIKDVDGCLEMIRKCDAKHGIDRNPNWLAAVEMYLRSLSKCGSALAGWAASRGTEEAICNSYDRNIMVDLYGTARLCFSPIFAGVKLDRYGDLEEFWNRSSLPIRDRMVGCKQFCGISHSVRKERSLNALL